MAKSSSPVLLGYFDEPILANQILDIGYWTNKVGGQPNWISHNANNPICSVCSTQQLLVAQIYAPLEDSKDHRTLYVFACLNAKCWNVSNSWTCWRCQGPAEAAEYTRESKEEKVSNSIEWCTGASDWGEVDDDNGNVVSTATDSDDSSLSAALGALAVDKCNANANWLSNGDLSATAELEADESEVVTIDTPTAPSSDLTVLLSHTNSPFSLENASKLYFAPFYLAVAEEVVAEVDSSDSQDTQRLLEDYESHDVGWRRGEGGTAAQAQAGEDGESYEDAIPAHGDALFHKFITRIQKNPGQVLRYCRGSVPLLIGPVDVPRKCSHCQGSLVFELQLLPTLVSQLRLQGFGEAAIEFGNVLIYSCEASCWTAGDKYREEIVCVQSEQVF